MMMAIASHDNAASRDARPCRIARDWHAGRVQGCVLKDRNGRGLAIASVGWAGGDSKRGIGCGASRVDCVAAAFLSAVAGRKPLE